MYLLNWSAQEGTIYAGVGGVITHSEMSVMNDELTEMLDSFGETVNRINVDAVKVSRFDTSAREELEKLTFIAAGYGAVVNLILEDEVDNYVSPELQAILDGSAPLEVRALRAA